MVLFQANVYSYGESERIIAKALKTYNIARSKVVILSKCFGGVPEPGDLDGLTHQEQLVRLAFNDGPMVNRVGLSRKHIFDAVNASVERLGTYLDVLQIHRLDRETPRKEIMKALNDVVESGKVRYIGASSVRRPPCEHDPSPLLIVRADARLGISNAQQHCREEWLAQIH